MSEHKQKVITIRGKKIMVDEDMVELIVALNNVGLETLYCCQGKTDGTSRYVTISTRKIDCLIPGENQISINWSLSKFEQKAL